MTDKTKSAKLALSAARIVGVLVLCQVLFWVGLFGAENAARPDGLAMAPHIDVYAGDSDGRIAAGATPTRVVLRREPGYVFRQADRSERTNAVFAHDFATAEATGELALYIAWTRRIMDVRVNDRLLTASTATDHWGILGGFEPVIYTIPVDYLRATSNRLTVTVTGRVSHVMPVFFIGDPGTLARAHTWGRVFAIDLVIAATGVLLFVLLLTLTIDWPPQDRLRIRALSILLGAWALRNLSILDFDSWIPDPWRLFFHFAITFAFLYSLLAFALGWTGRSRRWHHLALASFGLVIVTSLIAMSAGSATLFRVAFLMETALSIVIGLLVCALLLAHYARGGGQQTAEMVLFLLCTTVVMVDAIDDRFQITVPFMPDIPLTFYAAPMCGLLLALGMAASLAAQNTRARRAVMSINETLERRLAEREKEIEASYARQAEYEKHKTLADERQRIVRDMHDGMGGQLVSLLMRARNSGIPRHELTGELQSTLDDLRLVVHSMNNVGDSLDTALGTFREKIEPQLQAANVALDWQIDIDDTSSGFGPHAVLQIYRILQEACTNAMRHAGADRVSIHAERRADDKSIRISVIDNGKGLDPDTHTAGHGLRNMQARAKSLGGQLSVTRVAEGHGTVVQLDVASRDGKNERLTVAS